MCLGEDFARMLLFLFCGHIIYHFEIGLDAAVDFKGECGITLTPADCHLTFQKLDIGQMSSGGGVRSANN